MITVEIFQPAGNTVTISGTTTSSSATIATNSSAARVCNSGTVTVFVRFGTGSATATAADMPLLGGQCAVFPKAYENDTVAVICSSTTATVYVTPVAVQ